MGELRIISSGTPADGEAPWEHVSVSSLYRCPTWDEMKAVKELFWHDEETVIQFHPRKSAYVSVHPYTLHLWRNVEPFKSDYELPPSYLIA